MLTKIHETFNWLPHSHIKGLPLPKVYLGQYNPQFSGVYYVDSNEIIVTESPNYPEEKYITAILVHEIRHAQQRYFNLVKWVKGGSKWEPELGYEKAITKYFRTQQHEFDALFYEHKYAKTDINDWWLKELVL